MKVRLNWVSKNTKATFPVEAADLEGALKVLRGRAEWAVTDYGTHATWEHDGRGNVLAVTVDAQYTITMPLWRAYRRQPQTCKDEWDTMWRALRKHEDGHRERHEQGVSKLIGKLEALRTATVQDVKDIVNQELADLESDQEAYDVKTDHGKSQGVELTIMPECRSKRERE